MSLRIILIVLVSMWVLLRGQLRAADDSAPKTGAFQLKISERSAASEAAKIIARMGWTMEAVKKSGVEEDYDLAKESYEAVVPKAYEGKEPYGLFVWISPGPSGSPPREWLEVLAKHKLIWIGANHSENDRPVWIRLGLAIDAAQHIRKTYSIDEKRVYISGLSGGGRCASHLGILFPELFTGGGCYIIGCNFYRAVNVPEQGRKLYPPGFARPKPELMKVAQLQRRHVFLTGDNDQNRDQTKANYEAAQKDGFKHITYLQVPGMGHQSPDAEWFEKAIDALDDPKAMNGTEKGAKGKPQKTKPTKAEKP